MRFTFHLFLGMVCLALNLEAQFFERTNNPPRQLTLHDCVRLALEHNLELAQQRFRLNRERFQLRASYGNYDPELTHRFSHDFDSREGVFNPSTGISGASRESSADRFRPSLDGRLPWGLQYSLGGEFSHSTGNRGVDDRFNDWQANVDIQLTQPLLRDFWIDSTRLDIQIRKKDLQISEALLEDQVRQVIKAVEKAYYELIFDYENVRVRQQALELASVTLDQTQQKIRVGTVAQSEEEQVKAQVARARGDLIEAKLPKFNNETALIVLMSRTYGQGSGTGIEPMDKLVAVPLTINIRESWATALAQRPDLKDAQLQAEQLGLETRYRRNQLLPALDIFGGYGRSGVDSFRRINVVTNGDNVIITPGHNSSLGGALDDISAGRNPSWNVGLALSFPLGNRQARNRLRATEEQRKEYELRHLIAQHNALAEVETAQSAAAASLQLVQFRREQKIAAEQALANEEKKLENGRSTYIDVLRFQDALSQARSAEIRAVANYNKALADLRAAEGTNLRHHKVTLNFK